MEEENKEQRGTETTGQQTQGNAPKEKRKFLGVEGTLVGFLTKTGHIIMLNIVWLLCCIPIFTIGTATTSLYYAMVKNIRHDRGYPISEFFSSFKRTFWSGSVITVVTVIWLGLLYYLRMVALSWNTESGIMLGRTYVALMVVTAAVLIYLFPVLSRFVMKLTSMAKLAFVMSIRYLSFTIIILGLSAGLAWLYYYYLPIPMILVLPGVWCYICTFLIEKPLRKYMPQPKEGEENAWYYE